jgi:hypothetical protein
MAARVAEAGPMVVLHLLLVPMAPLVDGTLLLPLTEVEMPGVVVVAAAAGKLLETFRTLAVCLMNACAAFIRQHAIEHGDFELNMARTRNTRDMVEYAEAY